MESSQSDCIIAFSTIYMYFEVNSLQNIMCQLKTVWIVIEKSDLSNLLVLSLTIEIQSESVCHFYLTSCEMFYKRIWSCTLGLDSNKSPMNNC